MPSKRSAPKGKSSKSKKSKHNNRKRAPPVYWGKPASIYVGGQSLALESAKLPESAKAVSVQDFDGTWKLDTDKSETLEAYLKTMGVTEIACEAAMKAEKQYATYHVITIEGDKYTVSRKSRMANRSCTYSFATEHVETRKSGREFKILVRKSDTPRIVEETTIDNKQRFTLTRTLVMKDRMHCRQVLKIPSKAVVTQRYFDRTTIPKDFEIDEEFMKNKPEPVKKKITPGSSNNSTSKKNMLLTKNQKYIIKPSISKPIIMPSKPTISSVITKNGLTKPTMPVTTTTPYTAPPVTTNISTSSISNGNSSGLINNTTIIGSNTIAQKPIQKPTITLNTTKTNMPFTPNTISSTNLGLTSTLNVNANTADNKIDTPIFINKK